MNYILGRFKVDIHAWKSIIENDRATHEQAGLHFQQVWQNVDDPREIFFLFSIDDIGEARTFLERAGALDKDKAARGEIPTLTFLENR